MAFHSYTHLIQKLFNAYWFGPPSRGTGTSSWTCVDHSVSRLPPPTLTPRCGALWLAPKHRPFQTRFRCGSGSLSPLPLPEMATRRFIMQKARRHTIMALRPLVGVWFQVLFHSRTTGAFHLSLTVLVHYRSLTSI